LPANVTDLEKRLWDAADELRANSKLKASEYGEPVLGLIFLRHADARFTEAEKRLQGSRSGRRQQVSKYDYQAEGVVYVPEEARFSHLLRLPEGEDLGRAINDAMRLIEEANEDLKGVLPRTYARLETKTLVELLKLMASIPTDIEGDAFGKIYEYFLGKFAMAEGQKGGEFFTPTSLVRLIVEIIEPWHGRIYDPACGSGGMFVQSARFVEEHKKDPGREISIYGQERAESTVRLCNMNLAVHGLAGDIREANSYYEDLHTAPGRFDYVMANPPFNVNRVDKERLKDDRARFPFGMPTVDNANYLWIQLFYSSLNDSGRAGFVMANSAGDARRLRARDPKAAPRVRRGRRDRRDRFQLLLHRDPTLHALVPRPREDRDRARRSGAVPRRPAHLPPARPGAPRFSARADRVSRQHCAPLSGRGTGERQGQRRPDGRAFPGWRLSRRAGPLQARHAGRHRGAGLEPESWPLCRRGRPSAGRIRVCRPTGGAERKVGAAQPRGARTRGANCSKCGVHVG
jgi:hypothetical protein